MYDQRLFDYQIVQKNKGESHLSPLKNIPLYVGDKFSKEKLLGSRENHCSYKLGFNDYLENNKDKLYTRHALLDDSEQKKLKDKISYVNFDFYDIQNKYIYQNHSNQNNIINNPPSEENFKKLWKEHIECSNYHKAYGILNVPKENNYNSNKLLHVGNIKDFNKKSTYNDHYLQRFSSVPKTSLKMEKQENINYDCLNNLNNYNVSAIGGNRMLSPGYKSEYSSYKRHDIYDNGKEEYERNKLEGHCGTNFLRSPLKYQSGVYSENKQNLKILDDLIKANKN